MSKTKNFFILFLISLLIIPALFISGYSNSLFESLNLPYLEKYLHQSFTSKSFEGYSVTLLIDQPVPNSRTVITNGLDAGHMFLRLAKHGKNAWTSYIGFRAKDFSKATDITSIELPGEVLWQKDAKSDWNIGKTFIINKDQARTIIDFAKKWDDTNTPYNLVTNNCATFPIQALEKIGITEETTGILQRHWTIPTHIQETVIRFSFLNEVESFFGYSPADSGEDIKSTNGWFVNKSS